MAPSKRWVFLALLAALAISAIPQTWANENLDLESDVEISDGEGDLLDDEYFEVEQLPAINSGAGYPQGPLPQPPYPSQGLLQNLSLPYQQQASYGPQNSYQVPVQNYQVLEPVYPQVNYQEQSYQVPVQAYQAPVQTIYQQPKLSYQAPQVQTYQVPQVQTYQVPQVQSYQAPQVQTYQAPVQNYTAPVQAYQTPVQQNYTIPVQTYQPQVQNYTAPVQTYQAPQVQSYQAPQVQTYQAPQVQSYQTPQVQTNQVPQVQTYQAPQVQTYQAPQVQTYQAPVQNYTTPVQTYQTPQRQEYAQRPVSRPIGYQNLALTGTYSTPALGSLVQYSASDLASIIPLTGYLSNHWSLQYYRNAPYKNCPKNLYLNGPTTQDIANAFAYALQQLSTVRDVNVGYLNNNQSSLADRNQVFSVLTTTNARMDEEALLLELVSIYLADRACLTKWDKQRYLPQLTKFLSVSNFPSSHSCNNLYRNQWQGSLKSCVNSRYRTYDGFCNNPYHPYWGKSDVCHIRLLSPDYADGISLPRESYNSRHPLPSPRLISSTIHNDIPQESPYNLMKMQWGQFINHDITNTAMSTYDGMVDCCKNPNVRGCWPILVKGDKFYSQYNVTCLNFIRSAACPTCQLGPRQHTNKNTAFLDASQVYGQNLQQANQLRAFRGGLLRVSNGKNGEILLPIADKSKEQCSGICFLSGDGRTNQHPALTTLHTLMLRNHNQHAYNLALRHPDWNDETIFQETRRLVIAEYQMITYSEYLPIVFGPVLSAYYKLNPLNRGYTYYEPKADPTTWNEYVTASCRFGHSQISSFFGLYPKIYGYGEQEPKEVGFPLREWFVRPSLLSDGMIKPIINGLLSRAAQAVDPWITTDVQNYLFKVRNEHTGGDLGATNIWRGRDHGIPGYIHYVEYCFNVKVRTWKDLSIFIPYYTLNQLRKLYRVVDNIDLFTGGLAERHFPGADIGPTFACINGIQYYHLKFGDRFYFEHTNQVGSFNPAQLEEIKRLSLAKLLCRTASVPAVPQYAFLKPSQFNPLVNCSQINNFDYNLF